MKRIISILLIICAFSTVYGQKTAQEYFNVSALLYAENKQEAALYTVSKGCELFESDSSLAQLKRLIENQDQNKKKQNKKQQNQEEQGNQDNKDGDSSNDQNQSNGNNDNQNNGNKESQDKGNEQQNANQQEGQESQETKEGQKDDAKPQGDKKGQISERQAEMLLEAIDNNDKLIQQRLKQQKKQKGNYNKIEKNW